ncbi:hypothetical protein [Nonomuraea sp. NPDC049709]|uniref:hypothetical protein n=1 Tax=Nonomuraea sp. NPDC049709 TaxID=3154736 RepID=UPI00343EA86F
MSTFTPEFEGLPSEDDISEYLATVSDRHDHPYDPFPAQARPRPAWRGGPPIGPNAERDHLEEQDAQ